MKHWRLIQGKSSRWIRQKFGFLLPCACLLWAIGLGAAEHASAKDATHTVSTNERALIHPAFIKTGALIASTNLATSVHNDSRTEQEKEYQMLYELARTQRSQRNVDMATRNFVALLQGEAPEEIKRASLIELALLSQENNELAKAQQLFAQYLKRYPEDANMPEILLRQGLLYRQMGAPEMALAKFYAVMTGSLKLKFGSLDYYQRLVLQAQTEIADTFYLQGKYLDATDFLSRLLKLEAPGLNKAQIQFKLVRCLAALNRRSELIAQAQDFLQRREKAEEEPEVRYLLAQAYKESGQNQAALQQVFQLLKLQQSKSGENLKNWYYWQQRAGNTLANQLYQEGDYLNALAIYQTLGSINSATEWQFPVLYQIGLIYEKLHQPTKALESYGKIITRQKELDSNASPSLKTVLDMARWRTDFIQWQASAGQTGSTNSAPILPSASASR
jgi:tetratricopeptide (TPR) repeat protein